jgi:polyisoprenoid-binding protein YceI
VVVKEVKIINTKEYISSIVKKSLCLVSICMISASAFALKKIDVDNTNSRVSFSGEHVGMVFDGVFEKWKASLILPPENNPAIDATFYVKSAKTGDFTYDSTLPEGDWFDANNHPVARFTSDSIEVSIKGYKVTGNLELRGVSKPQTFELIKDDKTLTAQFVINRLDYGIGLESDPDAEWVSQDIIMELSLQIM